MNAPGCPGGGRLRKPVCTYRHSGLSIDGRRDGCVASRAECIGYRLRPPPGGIGGIRGFPHYSVANPKSCYRE